MWLKLVTLRKQRQEKKKKKKKTKNIHQYICKWGWKRVNFFLRWLLEKLPGFPGRLLFFLTGAGGCEFVLEPLLLFVVVVEVWECGLWNWPSISDCCCLTAASSLVFSVEKLPLSQLVMFDIEGSQRKGKNLLKIFPLFNFTNKCLFVLFHSACWSCYSCSKMNFVQKKTKEKKIKGEVIETEKMGFVQLEEDKNQETLLLLWCRDEGVCWHKNTRTLPWICNVIKKNIQLYFF